MSVLDAATNDLAQLINHLDLEAMPGSWHNCSPIQQSPSSSAESHHLLKLPQPQWSSRLHCRISYHRLPMLSQSSEIKHDSILNSILAHATEIPSEDRCMWLESDSSSKRGAQEAANASWNSKHARQESALSFTGFDSFAEIRRGFKFTDDCPSFYPPAATRKRHHQQASAISMATFVSQSSYGQVINLGSLDPFDYGEWPRLPRIPQSEDDCSTSMSMSVDDTFSFIRRGPRDSVHKWVDSDASSFYFCPPSQSHSHMIQPYNHAHRWQDSALSVSSVAPPISLHNRSFMVHQRNDSNTSTSSMAFSHAMHGANSGWAAWAKHRQDSSMDSVTSDFSTRHLGHPGVGDKIFESAPDYGMPLTSISASPHESVTGKLQGNGTSYDSILDGEGRRSSMEYEDHCSSSDSLFDQTGNRSSVSSETMFGYDELRHLQGNLLPSHQFRPLSAYSDTTRHSPHNENDTMISVRSFLNFDLVGLWYLIIPSSDVGWGTCQAPLSRFHHRSFAMCQGWEEEAICFGSFPGPKGSSPWLAKWHLYCRKAIHRFSLILQVRGRAHD